MNFLPILVDLVCQILLISVLTIFVIVFQGRSKSLTSIDTLDPSMPGSNNNGPNGGKSGGSGLDLEVGGRLSVPMWSGSTSADHSPTSPGFHRRRKLSTASKVIRPFFSLHTV